MNRIETGVPDRLCYREPYGRFVVLSLALWLLWVVGPLALTVFLLNSHYIQEVGSGIGAIVVLSELFWCGLFLTWMVRKHTRVGTTIDRAAGALETSVGFLCPFFSEKHALSKFQRLAIRRQAYHYGRIAEVKYH